MVDPLSQLLVEAITHSEANPEKQKEMHQRDEGARWFNMRRVHNSGKPELYVYDRFIKLCDPSKSGNTATKRHYPSFVSFVGDTSVGKSTLVRAMLLMGLVNSSSFPSSENNSVAPRNDDVLGKLVKRMSEKGKEGPVTRSENINHLTDPTTLGVHLYLDQGTTVESDEATRPMSEAKYPILFSDCEGFGAGDAITNAERMDSDAPEIRGREFSGPRNRSPSRREQSALQLQVKPHCYSRGKEGVDLFYARFLYAISDVVVFITKEDQKIQSELVRVLEWASRAVHKSVNHPSRKTLIIVRHMASIHKPILYEVEELRKLYLYSDPDKLLWEDSPILKAFVEAYNNKPETVARYDLRITTNDRLYNALFHKITCCYIPNKVKVKGRPQELYKQYRALRAIIESSVRDGLTLRAESVMQYNVPALSHILTRAFAHFAASEDPFDFYLAARRDNPNPQTMQDHIANFLRHAFECSDDIKATNEMVIRVTSIALLIDTYHRFQEGTAPNPADIFEREFYDIWSRAVEIYRKEYEKCAFQFRDGPCTSRPWKIHQQHTSAKGHFEPGTFKHQREWNTTRKNEWIIDLRRTYSESYETIFKENPHTSHPTTIEDRLNSERNLSRKLYCEMWKKIKSNKTCLSCLQAVPDHVLRCGHSYCPRCVQELGRPSSASECAWEMHCWLCWEERGQHTHQIQLKPRCAGARILTLDGGGIRGIVELSVLHALQDAVGLDNFSIRNMFDLIVGTSTGGIISLALAMTNASITEMETFFRGVSEKTFSQTTAGVISRIGPLKKLTTYTLMILRLTESVFSSESLKEGLKSFFKDYHPLETSLFAPALHSQPSSTRVAVTSAKDLGQTTCLITSYNHPLGNPTNNLEREEDSEKDIKIWEAALATSAAPFYLPPFEKKETNTQYVDGAVYANCPAEVAYGEMEKLWPDKGASLDYLVSLGTGDQKAKHGEAPTLVNMGFFVSIRAMFQRQLDSKSSWAKFEQQTAPLNARSRLYRLDPPLKGEHVELYEHKRLQEIRGLATEWTRTTAAANIQELADTLIANLFFFEPDDAEATNSPVSSSKFLSDPSCTVLAGSIRCRLSHESPQLEKLLGEMVEGFCHAETRSDSTADVGRVQNWTKIEHPLGPRPLLNCMVSEVQYQGHEVKRKFRLPFTFMVKKNNIMYQVLAMKLKRSEKRIAISGFPSTIDDLVRRSKLKWLQ
ncbi:hypothetical protein V8E51_014869 [Hyaloscypha variabilis]